jgi:hypothetical protein
MGVLIFGVLISIFLACVAGCALPLTREERADRKARREAHAWLRQHPVDPRIRALYARPALSPSEFCLALIAALLILVLIRLH